MRDEKVVIEIENLVNNIEKVQENIDVYCELMKRMFLNTSGLN